MPASKKSLISRLRAWFFFLVPALFIGMIVGAYPGYKLYHYVWYDAQFCTTCHVHDYINVAWSQSVHGQKTTCHDCHHQRLRDYIKEAVIMATHKPTFPQDLHHTPYVQKSLCAACHVSDAADRSTITGPMALQDVKLIPKVDLSKLHKVHSEKMTDLALPNYHPLEDNERNLDGLHPSQNLDVTKGEKRAITCIDCHGGPANRGHHFSAVDHSCLRCHEKAHNTAVGKEYGCRSCHFQDFLIPAKPEKK